MTYHFCPICGVHHEPDIPCFEAAKQVLKDAGIPQKKQKWTIKNLKKWVRITAILIILGPIIVLIWTAVVNLSRYLQK
jgi:hypothetical protein